MSGNLRKIASTAAMGAYVDIACAVFKAVVGIFSGSYALMADAVHSASDLVTDIAVAFGAKYWMAPADDGHPYGHGKMESVVVLFISAALFATAVAISCTAFGRGSTPDALAGAVAFSAAVVKAGLAAWTFHVAVYTGSPALKANAWHHMSDALSSVPVAVAVFISSARPELTWLDPAAAVLVAAVVAKTAWSFAKKAILELVDADIPEKTLSVAVAASRVSGVKNVHKARTRQYGCAFQADLHVQVDSGLTVKEGHDIAHGVKDRIMSECDDVSDVVVHVEPYVGT